MALRKINGIAQFLQMTHSVMDSFNSAIPKGVLVYASDTKEIKLGNGRFRYNQLPIFMNLNTVANNYAALLPMLDIVEVPDLPDDIDKVVIVNDSLKLDYGMFTVEDFNAAADVISGAKTAQDDRIADYELFLNLLASLTIDDEGKIVVVNNFKYTPDVTIDSYIENTVKSSISTYLFNITDIEFYSDPLLTNRVTELIHLTSYYALVKTENDVDNSVITYSMMCSNPNILITKDLNISNKFKIVIPEILEDETDAFIATCNNAYATKNFTNNMPVRNSLDIFGILNVLFFKDAECTIPIDTPGLVDNYLVNGEYYAKVMVSNPDNAVVDYMGLTVIEGADSFAFEWVDHGDFSWIDGVGFSWLNTVGDPIVVITQVDTSNVFKIEISDIPEDLRGCVFNAVATDGSDINEYNKQINIINVDDSTILTAIEVYTNPACTAKDELTYLKDNTIVLGSYFFKIVVLENNNMVVTYESLVSDNPNVIIERYGDNNSNIFKVDIVDIDVDIAEVIFTATVNNGYVEETLTASRTIYDISGGFSVSSLEFFTDVECTIPIDTIGLIDNTAVNGMYYAKLTANDTHGFLITYSSLLCNKINVTIIKYADDKFSIAINNFVGNVNDTVFTGIVNNGLMNKNIQVPIAIIDPMLGLSIASVSLYSDQALTLPITFMRESETYYAKVFASDVNSLPIEYLSLSVVASGYEFIITHRTDIDDSIYEIFTPNVVTVIPTTITASVSNGFDTKNKSLIVNTFDPLNSFRISDIIFYSNIECTIPVVGNLFDETTYYIKIIATDDNGFTIDYNTIREDELGAYTTITKIGGVNDPRFSFIIADIDRDYDDLIFTAGCDNGYVETTFQKYVSIDNGDSDLNISNILIFKDSEHTIEAPVKLNKNTTYYAKMIAEQSSGFPITYMGLSDNNIANFDISTTIDINGVDANKYIIVIGNVANNTSVILTATCKDRFGTKTLQRSTSVIDPTVGLTLDSVGFYDNPECLGEPATKLFSNSLVGGYSYMKIIATDTNGFDITYSAREMTDGEIPVIPDPIPKIDFGTIIEQINPGIFKLTIPDVYSEGDLFIEPSVSTDYFTVTGFTHIPVIKGIDDMIMDTLFIYDDGDFTKLSPTTQDFITPAGVYPGSYSFNGGVLLNDGRVFCVPYGSTTARIYDPVTKIISTPAGVYPGNGAFVGGVLLPDGRVFCVPSNSTTARIYDPVTNTLITPTGIYPSGGFYGGVLLNDGRVFLVPYNSTTARIYDPVTDTLSTPAGTYPESFSFYGGVLLPDGRVFCVPYSSTSARIYDPVTNTLTTPAGVYPGNGAFYGGVLLPDGRVFCVPSYSTTARIYDPVTNTLTTPTGTYPGNGAFANGILLPDGRVFCIPFNSASARIYDPIVDTLTTPTGTYIAPVPFLGGVLLLDGRVFLVPYNSTTARIYDPYTTYDLFELTKYYLKVKARDLNNLELTYNTPQINAINTPIGTYPGSSAFCGGVSLPDGRIFCVPFISTTARIYDPVAKILSTPAGTYPGGSAFRGGVLLHDGRVFLVPYNSTTARIYDPVANTLTTPTGTYPGNGAFRFGVLLPDGRVFCVPFMSTTARIYDPISDTVSTPAGTYTGGGAFVGGVLLPDGRVFCVPCGSGTARIYDPVANTLTTPSGTYPGDNAFYGGVLLPDGRVFCVPSNSTTARIYDPVSNTVSTPAGTYPGSYAFTGGILLSDGRVFCVPDNSTTARIYNPVTDTLITPSGDYPGNSSFIDGILLLNGRVFLVPFNSTTARIYNPYSITIPNSTIIPYTENLEEDEFELNIGSITVNESKTISIPVSNKFGTKVITKNVTIKNASDWLVVSGINFYSDAACTIPVTYLSDLNTFYCKIIATNNGFEDQIEYGLTCSNVSISFIQSIINPNMFQIDIGELADNENVNFYASCETPYTPTPVTLTEDIMVNHNIGKVLVTPINVADNDLKYESFTSITLASDGKYLAAGLDYSTSNGCIALISEDFSYKKIIKTNRADNSYVSFSEVIESDGYFYVVGSRFNEAYGKWRGFVAKYNYSTLSLIQDRYYCTSAALTESIEFNSVAIKGTTLYIVGKCDSVALIVSLNADTLEMVDSKKVTVSGWTVCKFNKIKYDPDSDSLIVIGNTLPTTSSNPFPLGESFIIKLNTSLVILYQRVLNLNLNTTDGIELLDFIVDGTSIIAVGIVTRNSTSPLCYHVGCMVKFSSTLYMANKSLFSIGTSNHLRLTGISKDKNNNYVVVGRNYISNCGVCMTIDRTIMDTGVVPSAIKVLSHHRYGNQNYSNIADCVIDSNNNRIMIGHHSSTKYPFIMSLTPNTPTGSFASMNQYVPWILESIDLSVTPILFIDPVNVVAITRTISLSAANTVSYTLNLSHISYNLNAVIDVFN